MNLNLDDITKALAEATQGPWEVGYDERSPSKDGMFWWIHCPKGSLGYMPKPDVDDDNYVRFKKEDANLIANAPEWLRLLVERVRATDKVVLAAISERDNHHRECQCYFCEAVDAYKKECL